jgi:protein phosphatase
VFVVADGMGGHAAGEVASGLVAAEFERLAGEAPVTTDAVLETITRANAAILAEAVRSGDYRGMGTTVVGLALVTDGGAERWLAFNVGDSRLYRAYDGVLERVSVDHSEVQELLDAGKITVAQSRIHPRRNIITRALGSDPAPPADSWLLEPVRGERFLLCSDGLSNELDDEEIFAVLSAPGCAEALAARLVDEAVAAGGRDNVTAIVVDVVSVTAAGDGDDRPESAETVELPAGGAADSDAATTVLPAADTDGDTAVLPAAGQPAGTAVLPAAGQGGDTAVLPAGGRPGAQSGDTAVLPAEGRPGAIRDGATAVLPAAGKPAR